MKKSFLIISIIAVLISLSGCGSGLYNLSLFILPDDVEFLVLIQELNTPQKICQYMKDNFTYKENIFYSPNPYELFLIQQGDCNDFCTFAIFMANYHNYETYQIRISFKGTFIKHILAVYLENDRYNYSNIKRYCSICASSFDEIVSHYFINHELELKSYKVYDYDMNLIEEGR